ncbi:helix-turn-helix domain-containing protein [Lactobacillus sp. YT155]|uniref:helix-turn-helix domain-containing protein n=1 Tax=Lactobacillus sp. YT155 TaxID=3060955 RepID=UPI00265E217F|nr:helix-turn-helix domain-containing protein [Lactobacillus sp. YT155]MDO1604966.1 helix-turn-helix domain-containing protein [Lactobacillus sp. YT155]
MDLGQRLRKYREKQNYSQDELAQKLFVTRQAISRWENNKTIPSLYSLTQLADLYQIPVETLLKEDEYTVTKKIDKQVNRGKIYRNIILGAITIFVIFLGVLSYGRGTNNDIINRFNPFLPMKTEYGIVPEKTPTKIETVEVEGKNKKRPVAQPVKAWVTNNPFGDGEWLKFEVGMIPEKGMNYVILQHKGSYVKQAKLIKREDIPRIIRLNISDEYMKYDAKAEPINSWERWNPFK